MKRPSQSNHVQVEVGRKKAFITIKNVEKVVRVQVSRYLSIFYIYTYTCIYALYIYIATTSQLGRNFGGHLI